MTNDGSGDTILPRDEPTLRALQGEARLRIWQAITELRELVEVADVADDAGVMKEIGMNIAAHHVAVAVKNYGRLLP